MLRKLLKKEKCPDCGTTLKNAQERRMTVLLLIEELMFFGGLGLFIFGRGNYDIYGGVLIVLSIIVVLLFMFVLKSKFICPQCDYKTTDAG